MFWNFKTFSVYELCRVVATLWWTIIYMCLMDGCRTKLFSAIYLISFYLSLLMMVNAFWMAMCCFQFFLKSWPSYSLLLCEITCHIAFLFMHIYLFTHTCFTPRIAKFRGSFCLDVCKSCIDDSNWNSNSRIHQGGALHKFWGSKVLKSFFLITA